MASARESDKVTAWMLLQVELTQSSVVLYNIIKEAISTGTPEENRDRVRIFDAFWNDLVVQKGKSLEEIRDSYSACHAGLIDFLDRTCAQLQLKRDLITADNLALFRELIPFHQMLRGHQLVLWRFETEAPAFHENLRGIGKKLHASMTALHQSEMRELQQLEHIVEMITERCVATGHVADKYRFTPQQRRQNYQDESLQEELAKLPLVRNVSDTVDRLMAAVEKQDDTVCIEYRAQLAAFKSIYEHLLDVFTLLMAPHLEPLNAAHPERKQNIPEVLNEVRSAHDFNLLREINAINGCDEDNNKGYDDLKYIAQQIVMALNKSQSKVRTAVNILKWQSSPAEQNIRQCVEGLAQKLKDFYLPYIKHDDLEMGLILRQFTQLAQREQEIHKSNQEHNKRKSQLLTVWNDCKTALTDIVVILTGHINAPKEGYKDYVVKFLSDHWGKMSIGGVSGSGIAVGVLLLLSITNPAALITVGCAGLIGGAGGGGIVGAVKDTLFPPPKLPDTVELKEISVVRDGMERAQPPPKPSFLSFVSSWIGLNKAQPSPATENTPLLRAGRRTQQ